MSRACTVCSHPERQAIDKALVAAASPYRTIAERFQLSPQALLRHKADHLLAEIVAGWQAERHGNGQELADELREWMRTITKLLRACDEWLTDPDDPERYDLGPRAAEVWVHYEEPPDAGARDAIVAEVVAAARALVRDAGADERLPLLGAVTRLDRLDEPSVAARPERPRRRKARLAELLDRVDGHGRAGLVTLVEHKAADPRKLVIDASKALEGHLRLLGELLGKLQTQGTINFLATPEWSQLEARMLAALEGHPDARLALAGALDEAGDGRAA